MNRWSWLLVIFGCLALLASLGDWKHLEVLPNDQPVAAGEPDLYMEKATITQYGEDGAVSYRLLSSEVRHYEDQGLTQLASPTMTLFRAPQPPWFARSKEGLVHDIDTAESKTAEEILLQDDVHLEQREPNRIEITTAALRVYPDRQFAETDQPVIIDTTSGRTSAVGMSGDLNTSLLKLFSSASERVHTIVLPDQFQRATTKQN
jgi:lipopolysaccharide export system protein LptC